MLITDIVKAQLSAVDNNVWNMYTQLHVINKHTNSSPFLSCHFYTVIFFDTGH